MSDSEPTHYDSFEPGNPLDSIHALGEALFGYDESANPRWREVIIPGDTLLWDATAITDGSRTFGILADTRGFADLACNSDGYPVHWQEWVEADASDKDENVIELQKTGGGSIRVKPARHPVIW